MILQLLEFNKEFILNSSSVLEFELHLQRSSKQDKANFYNFLKSRVNIIKTI